LCDATGFCYNFWIYLGKEKTYQSAVTKDIVMDFTKCIPQTEQKFCMITDSYFSSLDLANTLSQAGFYYCLCLKGNKIQSKIWDHIKQGLKKSHHRSIYNVESKQCLTAFNDRKMIGFVSNVRGGAIVDTKKRPDIASFYNKYMNAVDLFDQQLNYHWNNHKHKKWVQCWYYLLVKMVFTNISIYYNNYFGTSETVTELLKLLLLMYMPEDSISKEKPNQQKHFPTRAEKTGKCSYCLKHNRRSNTAYHCNPCQIYLHPDCWVDHHKGN